LGNLQATHLNRINLFFAAVTLASILPLAVISANSPRDYPSGNGPVKTSRAGMLSIERPAGFVENKGQLLGFDGLPHPEVKFYFEQGDLQIFVFENGLSYQFTRLEFPEDIQKAAQPRRPGIPDFEKTLALCEKIKRETHRMDMRLQGAARHPRITREKRSSYYINYYNRNTLDVHAYEKIRCHEVYPGIDWVIYIQNRNVKHEFIVHPGADPADIRMVFTGHDSTRLENDGSFSLISSMGIISEQAPVSFQQGKEVPTSFALESNILSFQTGNYSNKDTLVIDPSIIWSTFFGGPDYDAVSSTKVDPSGNVYVGGYTGSTVSIASSGHQNNFGGGIYYDAFLAKFSSTGSLLWATYYGGSGADDCYDCTTDGSGNVYLSGTTTSTTNIASGGHQNTIGGSGDAYLVKFNSAGTRQWGTYYGGGSGEAGYRCTTDFSGNVYLVGTTSSTANIASGGFYNTMQGNGDSFIVKMNGAGQLQWASYYGGPDGDVGYACATDAAGNVYMAGDTKSSTGIASGGHQNTYASASGTHDGYLVKFNSSGARLWATYYGDYYWEFTEFCATNAAGDVYLAGITQSTAGIASGGYQNTHGGNFDSYIVKFNSSGVRQWGTYFGGTGDDAGAIGAVDGSGGLYLVGTTTSTAAIASGTFLNTYHGGQQDAFMARFSSGGQMQWASYYGSNGHEVGIDCAYDPGGYLYLAGFTNNSSFSMTPGSYQTSYGGGFYDGLLVKICDAPGQPPTIIGKQAICGGVVLTNTYYVQADPSATSYSWSYPGSWSGTASSNSLVVTPTSAGTITVTLHNACGSGMAQTLAIVSSPFPTVTVNSGIICNSQSFTIVPNGAFTYTFSGGTPVVSPTANASYSVTGTNSVGCTSTAAAVSNVTVLSSPVPTITVSSGSICAGQVFTLSPAGAQTYTYSSGTALVGPTVNSSYSVTGTSSAGCISNSPAVANVLVYPLPTISVTGGNICRGSSFSLTPGGAVSYTFSGGSPVVSPTTTTTYSVVGTSSLGCVSTTSALASVYVFPVPAISVNSGSICVGQTFNMYPSGANSYTYSGGTSAVSPTTTSSYSVTGTNGFGCVSPTAAVALVTVHSLPTITANSGSICSGETFTINASGASTYSYSSGSATVSPAASASYSVIGASPAGCMSGSSAVVNVTVVPLPSVSANSGSICSGRSFTIVPTGGSGYTFSGGPIVSPSVSTGYTVTGTGASGCVSAPVFVNVTVSATPTIVVNSGSVCEGGSFTITPTGAASFTFTGGAAIVSPSVTSSYSVSGTGTGGCVSPSPAIATVTVHALPVISVSSGSVCNGQSFTITPSGASSYSFSGGSQVVSPAVQTTYTVIGAGAAGCVSMAVLNVSVAPRPSLTVSGTRSVLCAGSTVTLIAAGAQTYTWNNGPGGATFVTMPAITATYSVTGADGNGCTKTATAMQSVSPCAAVRETQEWDECRIFPNPCTDMLVLSGDGAREIVILNSLGQVVLQTTVDSNQPIIDVRGLAYGVYTLRGCCTGRTLKFVRQD
jgi:hypothetical protein